MISWKYVYPSFGDIVVLKTRTLNTENVGCSGIRRASSSWTGCGNQSEIFPHVLYPLFLLTCTLTCREVAWGGRGYWLLHFLLVVVIVKEYNCFQTFLLALSSHCLLPPCSLVLFFKAQSIEGHCIFQYCNISRARQCKCFSFVCGAEIMAC